jgi:hypothetical protein
MHTVTVAQRGSSNFLLAQGFAVEEDANGKAVLITVALRIKAKIKIRSQVGILFRQVRQEIAHGRPGRQFDEELMLGLEVEFKTHSNRPLPRKVWVVLK